MNYKYTIMQINTGRDKQNHAFMGSDFLITYKGTSFPPQKDLYDEVYSSTQDTFSPESLFIKYNHNLPNDYRARSLSVSDILKYELPNNKTLYLYCDSFGFMAVDWDEEHKFATIPEYVPSSDKKSGVVLFKYITEGEERTVKVNPDDLIHKKKFGINQSGQPIELTEAEILNTIIFTEKHKMSVRGEEKIKTLKGWQDSGFRTFEDYVKPSNLISEDIVKYFINISPPVIWNSLYVQAGEPFDHITDDDGKLQPCYLTFKREDNNSDWKFVGVCFKYGSENLYIEDSVYDKFIKLM